MYEMKIYGLYPLGINSDQMKVCFGDSSHNTFSY